MRLAKRPAGVMVAGIGPVAGLLVKSCDDVLNQLFWI